MKKICVLIVCVLSTLLCIFVLARKKITINHLLALNDEILNDVRSESEFYSIENIIQSSNIKNDAISKTISNVSYINLPILYVNYNEKQSLCVEVGDVVIPEQIIIISNETTIKSEHKMRLIKVDSLDKKLIFQILDNYSVSVDVYSVNYLSTDKIQAYYFDLNEEKRVLNVKSIKLKFDHFEVELDGFIFDEKTLNNEEYLISIEVPIKYSRQYISSDYLYYDYMKDMYYLKKLSRSNIYGDVYEKFYIENFEIIDNLVFFNDLMNERYIFICDK